MVGRKRLGLGLLQARYLQLLQRRQLEYKIKFNGRRGGEPRGVWLRTLPVGSGYQHKHTHWQSHPRSALHYISNLCLLDPSRIAYSHIA